MTTDIEARLKRLEDREDIRALAARYTFVVDNRDIEGIASCFAEHARFRSKDGVMNARGHNEIMDQFRGRFSVLGPGAHYSHDHVVWFEDDDVACGLMSAHAELIRNGKPMIASLRYEDQYIRDKSRWVFADRLLSFFYYLNTEDYLECLGEKKRMRAYEEAQAADFPEALTTWRDYHN
ncbi:nuclear transport factor 2 family protein [Hyphococcus sp.]|uniref:nuclear transport factor 2 family protein n=1 Tax=Hyphococcus sp. TaxID=2038636 RepID=UPI003CCB798C